MFATLFASLFVQGILLGLAALALLAAAPRLQKTLRPAVALPPVGHAGGAASGAARACAPGPGGGVRGYHTAVQPDRPFAGSHRAPADGVPYMVAMEGDTPTATSCPAPSCRRDTARCWNASPSVQRG